MSVSTFFFSLEEHLKIFLDEIRQDLEDIMFRMKPFKHESNPKEIVWGGWAKMALPISGCRIVHVAKPKVGETSPAEVKADIIITLPKRQDLRMEWESNDFNYSRKSYFKNFYNFL